MSKGFPDQRTGAVPHVSSPSTLSISDLHQRLQALQKIVGEQTISEATRRKWCSQIAIETLATSKVMKSANFRATMISDLEQMAESYDKKFFEGHCLTIARSFGMQFRWSKRMTSTGGKTVRYVQHNRHDNSRQTRYEIVLSATLLFQTFGDLRRPVKVTGLLCNNRLEAMQRILEHEMIHLVEMLVWNYSCCSENRFQSIAWRFFGHTEHKHDLITQQERAKQKFNLRVGSHVQFRVDGQVYQGIVNRITRRATVLVADANGTQYTDGKRYRKFYVPLTHLEPVRAR